MFHRLLEGDKLLLLLTFYQLKLRIMKTRFVLLGLIGILSFGFIACNQTKKSGKDNSEKENQEQFEDLKSELNEVGDAIGDLFTKERDNFKESANEVLDDLERNIGEIKDKISSSDHPDQLKERLERLEKRADNLEKELNELDDKAEEEWDKAKEEIEKNFNALKSDIKSLFEEE